MYLSGFLILAAVCLHGSVRASELPNNLEHSQDSLSSADNSTDNQESLPYQIELREPHIIDETVGLRNPKAKVIQDPTIAPVNPPVIQAPVDQVDPPVITISNIAEHREKEGHVEQPTLPQPPQTPSIELPETKSPKNHNQVNEPSSETIDPPRNIAMPTPSQPSSGGGEFQVPTGRAPRSKLSNLLSPRERNQALVPIDISEQTKPSGSLTPRERKQVQFPTDMNFPTRQTKPTPTNTQTQSSTTRQQNLIASRKGVIKRSITEEWVLVGSPRALEQAKLDLQQIYGRRLQIKNTKTEDVGTNTIQGEVERVSSTTTATTANNTNSQPQKQQLQSQQHQQPQPGQQAQRQEQNQRIMAELERRKQAQTNLRRQMFQRHPVPEQRTKPHPRVSNIRQLIQRQITDNVPLRSAPQRLRGQIAGTLVHLIDPELVEHEEPPRRRYTSYRQPQRQRSRRLPPHSDEDDSFDDEGDDEFDGESGQSQETDPDSREEADNDFDFDFDDDDEEEEEDYKEDKPQAERNPITRQGQTATRPRTAYKPLERIPSTRQNFRTPHGNRFN